MTRTYLFGYQGNHYPLEHIETFDTWRLVHPEVRRRVITMIDQCPHDLGIGSGWRSTEVQDALFRSRYRAYHAPPGIEWDGLYWRKLPNVAPTVPPGRSYHESTDPMGYAFAVDLLNYQPAIAWANEHDSLYGLLDFEAVNRERWHYQPVEIPLSRRNYNPNIHTLRYWPLPHDPTPPSGAITVEFTSRNLVEGTTGNDVAWLQSNLVRLAGQNIVIDGQFGAQTRGAVENWQRFFQLTVDGQAGPQTQRSIVEIGLAVGK